MDIGDIFGEMINQIIEKKVREGRINACAKFILFRIQDILGLSAKIEGSIEQIKKFRDDIADKNHLCEIAIQAMVEVIPESSPYYEYRQDAVKLLVEHVLPDFQQETLAMMDKAMEMYGG